LPVSLENVSMKATLIDGRQIKGESKISRTKNAIQKVEIYPKNA